MIKASELRIGNVICDDEGVLAKVTGFAPFSHSVRCDEEEGCLLMVDCYHANGSKRTDCETDSPECEPIPLTPEWLGRCGFKEGVLFIKPMITSIRGANQDTEVRYCDAYGNSISRYCQYLHQLQNLYFALTSEELQIKLP